MPNTLLKQSDIEYIKSNRLKFTGTEMALHIGVSKSVVNRYMRDNGLSLSKSEYKSVKSAAMLKKSKEKLDKKYRKLDSFIRDNYLKVTVKGIAKLLNKSHGLITARIKSMGLVIPKELILQRKLDSQIKKGNIPANKGKKWDEFMGPEAQKRSRETTFKKGHIPQTTKECDGVITLRNDHEKRNGRKYQYIRLSLANWKPLHVYNWELSHGKIPKGHCLWFKDGNSLNADISNLELITRQENLRRNRSNYLDLPEDIRTASRLLNKLTKTINGKEQVK